MTDLTFKSDTKKRKLYFTRESFSHPAKMHLGLLLWMVGKYTKVGDTILDPMFGSGTLLVACTLGRNVIGVELEQKFVDMAKANWGKIQTCGLVGYPMGQAMILQGDARKLGNVLADVIVTSPPYHAKQVQDAEFYAKALMDMEGRDISKENASGRQDPENPSNIVNLKYGNLVDVIATSPPYEQSLTDGHTKGRTDGTTFGYTDVVITSPPYEEGGGHGGTPTKCALEKRQSSMGQGTDYLYGKTGGNIGNLKSASYLEAMLQVYQECHHVLKPAGLMILVLKDFIRKKKRVYLSMDTIKLCEQAGFVLEDWHIRKLTQQSFWRTLYQKKYPDAPKIDSEDILVFKKQQGGAGQVDVVVSSPPYEASVSDHKEGPLAGANKERYGRWVEGSAQKVSYTQHGEPCKKDTG